jgi:hypothetical protein
MLGEVEASHARPTLPAIKETTEKRNSIIDNAKVLNMLILLNS